MEAIERENVQPRAVPATAAAGVGSRRPPSRLRWLLIGMVVGVAGWFGSAYVINRTTFADHLVSPLLLSDTRGSADAIVVLGAGVVGRCEPNLNAIQRTLLAARLWRAGRAPILITTGGQETGVKCAVGQVMADLAIELGVPPEAVQAETKSRSTHENAAMAAPLLRRLGVRRILIVTDRLHLLRAARSFAREGFVVELAGVPVYAGHPNNVSMLVAAAREAVALRYYDHNGWLAPQWSAGAQRRSAAADAEPHLVPASYAVMPQAPRTKLVILGASYAAGWHPPAPAGLEVVNRGVAGQQSWQLLERFDADVVRESPRAVIIWGFINDIFRAREGQLDAAITRARESHAAMVARAKAAGIEPVLATEVTIRGEDTWSETFASWVGWMLGKEGHAERVNRSVRESNEWIRELARREGVLVLDLERAVAAPSGERRREFATPDGSHITPAGYAALSAAAGPILERHFAAPAGAGRP